MTPLSNCVGIDVDNDGCHDFYDEDDGRLAIYDENGSHLTVDPLGGSLDLKQGPPDLLLLPSLLCQFRREHEKGRWETRKRRKSIHRSYH